jgi:hypothetical protein
MIQNLRNELAYYKELVFSLPVEQSFLTKNVNNYSSLKYLNKAPNKTRVKQYVQDYSDDAQLSRSQTFNVMSHYTERRKERNYHLNKIHTNKNLVAKNNGRKNN